MPEYEIRLHKADGTLSVMMFTFAFSDAEAAAQARLMLRGNIVLAHVWRDDHQVGSERTSTDLQSNICELRRLAGEMRRSAQTASFPSYAEKLASAADELEQLALHRAQT
jgi:hypothetical protein